jgi:DmsE family decaheme c-type cytochrome
LQRTILFALALLCLLPLACTDTATLRSSQPIAPVRDFEALLVGNLMADYIGDENCLKSCHVHDKVYQDFKHSIHGDQISGETGLPLVNCESCHGPGSLAVEHAAEHGKCDTSQLLPLGDFQAQAQSMTCLKCHSAASTPNLHNWTGSNHANNDVSCFDCHQLHKGPEQKVARNEQEDLCFGCHQDIRMQFAQFSHHPVTEKKMVCTDCHGVHGTTQESDLLGNTVKETCTRCHMEYQGPFVYEHADVTETCTNCHQPHGSPNDPLLQVSQPFLCLQCHTSHLGPDGPGAGSSPRGALSSLEMKQGFYTRCTDCHSAIHGTDIPSAHGRGSFIAR